MASIEILIFALFTMFMAIATLEVEEIGRSIVFLTLSSVGVGTIFIYLGATYAGLFVFVLYAGVLIILFMVVASFTEIEEDENERVT